MILLCFGKLTILTNISKSFARTHGFFIKMSNGYQENISLINLSNQKLKTI